MAMDDVQESKTGPPHELHQMRITSHGKMHDFVEFALDHFKVCLLTKYFYPKRD